MPENVPVSVDGFVIPGPPQDTAGNGSIQPFAKGLSQELIDRIDYHYLKVLVKSGNFQPRGTFF
jgi:hypothetical protein